MKFLGVAVFALVLLIGLAVLATFIVLGIFLVKALIRYIKSKDVRKEKAVVKQSLGEVLKQHREECKMTQEFFAESIGENGTSDPSTSNLIAIAKLFNLSAEELLHEVQ